MGKWADRLAAMLAEEKMQTPPTEALTKLSKGGAEGLLSVLAVPTLGDAENFSAAANEHGGPTRPYRLSAAEADAAHAEAWTDDQIAAFVARVSLFMRRGIGATDADNLAERLHLRDVRADDRRLCIECAHLAGRPGAWRCTNHRPAGVGAALPRALVTLPQRCGGFSGG